MLLPTFHLFILALIFSYQMAYAELGPLLSVNTEGVSIVRPDISYNSTAQKYLVVWEGQDGIYGAILNQEGTLFSAPFSIAQNDGDNLEKPKVASNSSIWIVTYQRHLIQTRICYRIITLEGTISNEYYCFTPEPGQVLTGADPDIGCCFRNSKFLIVYSIKAATTSYGIHGVLLNASGSFDRKFTIAESMLFDRLKPTVNQVGNEFLVAWETHDSLSSSAIEARRVDTDDGAIGDAFTVIDDNGINEEPSIAEDITNATFLITWHARNTENDYDIKYAFTSLFETLSVGTITSTNNERRPCTVFAGEENNYCVSYAKALESSPWTNWRIFALPLSRTTGLGVEEELSSGTGWGSPEGTTAEGRLRFTWDHDPRQYNVAVRDWYITPLKPINPSPENGAVGVSTTITLSWENGGNTERYDVYFGKNPNPGSSEFKINQSATTFDPGPLDSDTTYYWRIDSCSGNITTQGAIWSFTTRRLPFLTEPSRTPNGANYIFTITYVHPDNVVPTYVRLVIPTLGTTYEMTGQVPGDTNYTDGKVYSTVLPLQAGTYQYHFEASDGYYNLRNPLTNEYSFTIMQQGNGVLITVTPSTVDVFQPTTVEATVSNSEGTPLGGVTVNFDSNGFPGMMSPDSTPTNSSGKAIATFTPHSSGSALITARVGTSDASDSAYLSVNPGNINFLLHLFKSGSNYALNAQLLQSGEGFDFQWVTFTISPNDRAQFTSTGESTCRVRSANGGYCDAGDITVNSYGTITITATHENSGTQSTITANLQQGGGSSFTAWKNTGYSGVDVDWSKNGSLIAIV